jgi:hypothetical protein
VSQPGIFVYSGIGLIGSDEAGSCLFVPFEPHVVCLGRMGISFSVPIGLRLWDIYCFCRLAYAIHMSMYICL